MQHVETVSPGRQAASLGEPHHQDKLRCRVSHAESHELGGIKRAKVRLPYRDRVNALHDERHTTLLDNQDIASNDAAATGVNIAAALVRSG